MKTMNFPKYTLLENERRYLIESLEKIDLSSTSCVQICDLYIANTDMRLRSVTGADGDVFKLCKKYPTDDYYCKPIVNTYLTSDEYAVLSILPGKTLSKRRYTVCVASELFSISVFENQLTGLVLCEAEKPTREEICALQFPAWATKEVTEDKSLPAGTLQKLPQRNFTKSCCEMDALALLQRIVVHCNFYKPTNNEIIEAISNNSCNPCRYCWNSLPVPI